MKIWALAVAVSLFGVGLMAPATPAMAAGSIAGTATAAGSGTPVAGLSVCAEENRVDGVSSGCTRTDASGHYVIVDLPAGPRYQVEFSSFGDLNFLSQYYHGREGIDNWDPVVVSDGASTEGVDAVMNPGAQITGHVKEDQMGAPAAGVEVCALDPAPNPRAAEFERCATTDSAGNYVVRSLPTGTYVVVFARYRPPVDSEKFGELYYSESATKATATPISITPPETREGIDATLVNRLRVALVSSGGPRKLTRHRGVRVRFRFSAQLPGAGFLCKRDNRSWRHCKSPQRFWAPIGRHAFRVRAVGPSGLMGPIAKTRFRIVRQPHLRRG